MRDIPVSSLLNEKPQEKSDEIRKKLHPCRASVSRIKLMKALKDVEIERRGGKKKKKYHLYSSARGRVIERIGIVHFMSINRLNDIRKDWWEDLHERNIKVNDFNLARKAEKDRKEGGVVLFVKKGIFKYRINDNFKINS